jgi:hypothetical protein
VKTDFLKRTFVILSNDLPQELVFFQTIIYLKEFVLAIGPSSARCRPACLRPVSIAVALPAWAERTLMENGL